jgi:hypothetical protein
VRQLAERIGTSFLRENIGLGCDYANIESFHADLVRHNVPPELVQTSIGHARSYELLKSIAAGWGAELVEELLGDAIFPVPTIRQVVYIKKENDQQSSLWLLDLRSAESKKILDDTDVTAPATPEALVAPITDNYFAFVRDAKTIWTYRDGQLKQIFPNVGS